MTTATITKQGEDFIQCSCGNAPHLDGFTCVNYEGKPVENEYGPTPEWNGRLMACNTCGTVFDSVSLNVYPEIYLS